MELSRQLFAEIIGVDPDAQPLYGPQNERRRHGRVAFDSRAKIFPLLEAAGGEGSSVLVRDISRAGMGFLLDEPMVVGDEFVIHLPRQKTEPIQIHSMVNRCEPGGTGRTQFAIGATFELVLNSTEPLVMPVENVEENAEGTSCADASMDGGELRTSQRAEDLYDQCIAQVANADAVRGNNGRNLLEQWCAARLIRVPLSIIACEGHTVVRVLRWLTAPLRKLSQRFGEIIESRSASPSRIRNRLRPTKRGKVAKTKDVPAHISPSKTEVVPKERAGAPTTSFSMMAIEPANAVQSPASDLQGSGRSRKSLFAAEPQAMAGTAAELSAGTIPLPVEIQQPTVVSQPAVAAHEIVIELPTDATPAISVAAALSATVPFITAEVLPQPVPAPSAIIPVEPTPVAPEPLTAIAAAVPPVPPVQQQVPAPLPMPMPVDFAEVGTPLQEKLNPQKPSPQKPTVPTGSRIGLHTAYARHPRRRTLR